MKFKIGDNVIVLECEESELIGKYAKIIKVNKNRLAEVKSLVKNKDVFTKKWIESLNKPIVIKFNLSKIIDYENDRISYITD